MKKVILLLLTMAVLCTSLGGCGLIPKEKAEETFSAEADDVLDEDIVYPLYRSLSSKEKQLYLNICQAVRDYSESATVGVYKTEKALENAVETVETLYRQIFFEQSDIFWVDPYNLAMEYTQSGGEYRLVLKPAYLVKKKDLRDMQEEFEDKVDEIVRLAKQRDGDFEKVLFVHDYILTNARYDHDLVEDNEYDTTGINAYGCLMEGKTICSGYTMAFDLIMKRLGYECGAEFNSYKKFSLSDGHVWNYCKLGDEYYYFDLTWDDTAFESEYYQKYMEFGYTYFGVTREELIASGASLSKDAPTPPCNGREFNYYVYKGLNLDAYTKEGAEAIIKAQEGQGYAVLRFDSYGELLKAQTELIEKQEIYKIVPGVRKLSYVVSKSNLHLYIFFEE